MVTCLKTIKVHIPFGMHRRFRIVARCNLADGQADVARKSAAQHQPLNWDTVTSAGVDSR
jgi:hypothetical protein